MGREVHLVVAIVEVEDVPREHRGMSRDHLFANQAPCLVVVLLRLLAIVDAEVAAEVELEGGRPAGEHDLDSGTGVLAAIYEEARQACAESEDDRLRQLESTIEGEQAAHRRAAAVVAWRDPVVLDQLPHRRPPFRSGRYPRSASCRRALRSGRSGRRARRRPRCTRSSSRARSRPSRSTSFARRPCRPRQ